MSMGRASLRDRLLESGVRTVHEHGYARSGIREITAAAGVPQGSFTNHFQSKEAFGLAALDRYYDGIEARMVVTLRDEARSPSDRLRAYFDGVTLLLEEAGWRHGCLIGNMGLEAAEHSEPLRERLATAFRALTQAFAETVRAAQLAGEMRDDLDAEDIAALLMASWQGAMLRMKVERSGLPIERFKRVLLGAFLTAPVVTASKQAQSG